MKTLTQTVSGAQNTVTLDTRRIYSILNLDATDSIYLGLGSPADGADGENKLILPPGTAIDIGPGERILNFAPSANSPKMIISSIVATESQLAANHVS